MMIRVKRPSGDWDEIPGGIIAYHDRGGALHVQTAPDPVFYEAEDWVAFEILVEPSDPAVTAADEVVFPEGFV